MDGINVVGVQFRRAGKLYDFSSGELELRIGDHVVVETDRGPSLAKVAKVRFEDQSAMGERELKPIIRRASQKELNKEARLTPEEVTKFTVKKVSELKLGMRVLQSDVQFGGNKVIVYFTAPGRVDFRELVKQLAGGLKTRIELKQVGARDETKLLGGVGICGREYCCSSFLREFVPVSIKMAKNQNLALNPSKVSGGCGRLLCCLTYEDDVYSKLRQNLPPRGTRVKLPEGEFGDVLKSDILNQLILVETEQGQQVSFPVDDCEIVEKGSKRQAAGDDWGDDIDLELLSKQLGSKEEEDVSHLDDEGSAPKKNQGRPGHHKKRHHGGGRQQEGQKPGHKGKPPYKDRKNKK